MVQRKNETKDLLLSNSKNCEMLIEHTYRKAEETLELKLTNSRETFFSNHQSQLKDPG